MEGGKWFIKINERAKLKSSTSPLASFQASSKLLLYRALIHQSPKRMGIETSSWYSTSPCSGDEGDHLGKVFLEKLRVKVLRIVGLCGVCMYMCICFGVFFVQCS